MPNVIDNEWLWLRGILILNVLNRLDSNASWERIPSEGVIRRYVSGGIQGMSEKKGE